SIEDQYRNGYNTGERFYEATTSTVTLWDVDSGKQILILDSRRIRSASFSPDGEQIITASFDKAAALWNAQSGKLIRSFVGHQGPVRAAAISPDGRRVVTGSDDKTTRIWDAESGNQIGVLEGHQSPVIAVSFSPDGRRILTGSDDKTARLWDAD